MEELRVDADGAVLAVDYSRAGPTAVVAVHGATDGTRGSSPLYEHLHATLPAHGIGVATFDRRGEGQSTGAASRGNFELQARDALAVAAALGAERVGVWGYSQGGWVAPLAAALSDDIAFVITVAAAGVSPAEQMAYANARQLELAGFGEATIREALALRRQFEEWVHERGAAPDLAAASAEPWFPLLYLPRELLDDAGRRRWIAEMDYDPRPSFEHIHVPALAFYGERDAWTPVEPSVRAWHGATVVIVPEAEHDLRLPDGTLAPLYERTLVEWLT
jgi:uncharacterized protein